MKRIIQKKTGATGDLISNKIADKIKNHLKKLSKELPSKNNLKEANNETEIPKGRHISPEKRQKIIDEPRLIK